MRSIRVAAVGVFLLAAFLNPLLAPFARGSTTLPWSQGFGGPSDQFALDVDVDGSRNVAIAGNLDGSINLGGGVLAGSTDMFIAKYDPDGAHLWSKIFNATGQQTVRGIAFDDAGNVVIVGYFFGTINLGGGALTSTGNTDIFVAKFDTGGTHVWSVRFGDADVQRGRCIAVDGSGNVIVGGEIVSGSAGFGGGALGVGLFLAKFDASGAHVWSKACGGANGQMEDVQVDGNDNVVTTGYFFATANFGGGDIVDVGLGDIFVSKLDASGVQQWVRQAGDASAQLGKAVAIDASGFVTVAGEFQGAIDFGGGVLTSAGGLDVFIAELDGANAHQWSRRFGDASPQTMSNADVGDTGNVVAVGYFSGILDFGGTPLSPLGADDMYIVQFDTDGNHVDSQQFGDNNVSARFYGLNVAVDDSDDAIVFGEFFGTIDLGMGPIVSAAARDVFLARLDTSVPVGIGGGRAAARIDVRNHPNPFNPSTTVVYELPAAGLATVGIYDARGSLVRTLVKDAHAAGVHAEAWDGRDANGVAVSSGVYFARLDFGNENLSRKLVLLK